MANENDVETGVEPETGQIVTPAASADPLGSPLPAAQPSALGGRVYVPASTAEAAERARAYNTGAAEQMDAEAAAAAAAVTGANFCPNCGYNLSGLSMAVSAPPPAPEASEQGGQHGIGEVQVVGDDASTAAPDHVPGVGPVEPAAEVPKLPSEADLDTGGQGQAEPPGPPPAERDNKAAWIDYAVKVEAAKGADPADVRARLEAPDGPSKTKLQEDYGTD